MFVKGKDEGRVFVTRFRGKVYFLKLTRITGVRYVHIYFRMMDGPNITVYLKQKNPSLLPCLPTLNVGTLNEPDGMELYSLMVGTLSAEQLMERKMGLDAYHRPFPEEAELSFHTGLFKTGRFKGKPFVVNSITNDRNTIVDSSVMEVFEDYVFIPKVDYYTRPLDNTMSETVKPKIIFRDVDRVADFTDSSFGPENIIINNFEIKSYFSKPYAYKKDFCQGKYTNSAGIEYDRMDLFEFFHGSIANDYDGKCSLASLYQMFDSYRQHYTSFYHLGFTHEELDRLAEEYLIHNVVDDTYFTIDTMYQNGKDCFFIDRHFFRLFYAALKRNRFKTVDKLEGLNPALNWKEQRYFCLFGLEKEEIQHLSSQTKGKTEDEFVRYVTDYYANQYGMTIDWSKYEPKPRTPEEKLKLAEAIKRWRESGEES